MNKSAAAMDPRAATPMLTTASGPIREREVEVPSSLISHLNDISTASFQREYCWSHSAHVDN